MLSKTSTEDVEEPEKQKPIQGRKWFLVFALVLSASLLCRVGNLQPAYRCAIVILLVLIFNLMDVMPLYCLAIFVPVLGTMCAVLGPDLSMETTAIRLVGQLFNSTSSLILGALCINGIFAKCGVVERMLRQLLNVLPLESALGLLVLMIGTTVGSSILYSCSIMVIASLRPFMKDMDDVNVVKRLLLGTAFASNAGSTWLTISSPVNLIAVSLLRQFDQLISPYRWAIVAIPVSLLTVIGSWCGLLFFFPVQKQTNAEKKVRVGEQRSHSSEALLSLSDRKGNAETMTTTHWVFMIASVLAVLAITIWDGETVEPLLGHPAMISLTLVSVTFGSGFLSRDEFLQLDWDLLMTVGGTNVIAFLVRETTLGKSLAEAVVEIDLVYQSPFYALMTVLICGLVLCSTFLSHTLTGVLVLPLVVAIGVKLEAVRTVAILCAIAVPVGMGMAFSSFDNAMAATESKNMEKNQGKKKQALTARDFRNAGSFTSVVGIIVILLLGGYLCVQLYGYPPPVRFSKAVHQNALDARNVETQEEVLAHNQRGRQVKRADAVVNRDPKEYEPWERKEEAWKDTDIHYRTLLADIKTAPVVPSASQKISPESGDSVFEHGWHVRASHVKYFRQPGHATISSER